MLTNSRVRWLVLLGGLSACNAAPERSDREAPAASAAATTGATAASSASASASATASAAAAAPLDLAGTWTGTYDAKKGTVALPPKVKDKALAADDGKTAAGPGSIEITIQPSGEIRGKTSGALGAGTISGKVDGAMIRTAVRPDDPQAPPVMSGVFYGERRGESIACELHVAGPDGTTIRESVVELTRKK